MKPDDSIFWLGSEASLRHVVDSSRQAQASNIPVLSKGMDDEEDDPSYLRILSVQDGVATVAVHGSLTNTDSFWNRFFGITSYNDIRNAVVAAIEDPDVSSIILDMDTPGGDAKGVNDLSDFLKAADKVKPIETYVSGTAFSAGYWIASATRKISGGKMSEAGSIGVIAILTNVAKAMKKAGYEVTVFRGGKYKALGNPYESLSEKAKSIIQAKIDTMEGFFLDAVSENRGIPRSIVKSQVGEGLTFFAEEAVTNGLMDEIISFDDFFAKMVKRENQGSAGRAILNEDSDMPRKVLTEKAVAAAAAGASEEEIKKLMEDEEGEASAEDAASESGDSASASEGEEGDGVEANAGEEGDGEGGDAAASEGEEEASAEDPNSIVAFLKAELKEVRAENAELASKLVALEAKSTQLSEDVDGMKPVVSEYINNMMIGLGSPAMALKDSDTVNLLAQYKQVRSQFIDSIKVGSVAEVQDDDGDSASSGESMSHIERASIKANEI